MELELDHFFILTNKPKEVGDLLLSMGLPESFSRDHPGQGTSNRRFEFANGMLEILYVRDRDESVSGPARNLKFVERAENSNASPFGVILTRTDDFDSGMPFDGWTYQPDYFDPPNAFHVGSNSEIIEEPLCIYVPFADPVGRIEEKGVFKSISEVKMFVPLAEMSPALHSLKPVDRLQILQGSEHLVEVTLDRGSQGLQKDFRPELPLIINW